MSKVSDIKNKKKQFLSYKEYISESFRIRLSKVLSFFNSYDTLIY